VELFDINYKDVVYKLSIKQLCNGYHVVTCSSVRSINLPLFEKCIKGKRKYRTIGKLKLVFYHDIVPEISIYKYGNFLFQKDDPSMCKKAFEDIFPILIDSNCMEFENTK